MFRIIVVLTVVLYAMSHEHHVRHKPHAGHGNSTNINLLGNKEIKWISISGCNRKVCNISNGKNYTASGVFRANQNSNSAVLTVQVLLNGTLSKPLNDFNRINFCLALKPPCPLKKHRFYRFAVNWTENGSQTGTKPILVATAYGKSGILVKAAIKLNIV